MRTALTCAYSNQQLRHSSIAPDGQSVTQRLRYFVFQTKELGIEWVVWGYGAIDARPLAVNLELVPSLLYWEC